LKPAIGMVTLADIMVCPLVVCPLVVACLPFFLAGAATLA
jgi:hypothetical protein